MLWPVDPRDDAGLQHREECWRLVNIGAGRGEFQFLEPWPVKPQPVEAIEHRLLSDHAEGLGPEGDDHEHA